LDGFIAGQNGGTNLIQQYLIADLVDDLILHDASILLGNGGQL
jgi:riboflavin biosynthesis pyrimidine reductase